MMYRDNYLTSENAELELWDLFKSGNRGAFEQLLKKHYSMLFRYASRFSRNRALVEDCVQDVFIYLWEHRQGVGVPVSIKFYLIKSVRNRMILELKGKTDSLGRNDHLSEPMEEGIEHQMIFEETQNHNLQKLSLLLKSLPERQKEALYLKYFEELKVDEIGDVMGVSRQSAANFLFRALSALRENWAQKTFSLIFLVSNL